MKCETTMRTFILTLLLALLASCTSREERLLQETLDFAGDNRGELEAVLRHYRNEPRKLAAARFLLIQMKDRHFYRSAGIDSIRKVLAVAAQQESCLPFDVEQKWGAYSYRNERPVYDVHVLTAEYLIENIELAFRSWHCRQWGKHCSFEDFCHYLLPYWIGEEEPDNWRRIYADRFLPVLDSIYRGTDVVEAVDCLQHYLKRTYPFCYNNDFSYPNLGGEYLLRHPVGACREETDFMTYLLRTVGVPVATDRYLCSPDAFLGHSWNVFRDTTGRFIPTELLRTGVSRKWTNRRRKGKVYRLLCTTRQGGGSIFGPRMTDVTDQYYPANRVEIPGVEQVPEGLIGVFSMNGWIPIGTYGRKGGRTVAENLETGGLVYQPLRRTDTGWEPGGYPFLTDGQGKARLLEPDTAQRDTVTLLRKHPLTSYWTSRMHEMDGVRFYGSNDPHFRHAVLLGESRCDTAYSRTRILRPACGEAFRYIRVSPPPGRRLNISELEVYGTQEGGSPEGLRVLQADEPLGGVADYAVDKAFDGQNLSRYEAAHTDTPCLLELDGPVRIGRIRYTACNDDNYVSPGDRYELFYQAGTAGWQSLGVKTAGEERLVYTNVPRNALLWLHDHTKGVEEQVFRWEDGRQQFCYRLQE